MVNHFIEAGNKHPTIICEKLLVSWSWQWCEMVWLYCKNL